MSKFKTKILVVEDDKDLNELLSLKLNCEGYEVFSFYDISHIEKTLNDEEIELLIIDRNLPSGDSLFKIKELRKNGYNEAVIFLTAKSLHDDLLDGFKIGCDDYICKPFDFQELLLRIKAILKRKQRIQETILFKNFLLNIDTREFFNHKEKIELSNLEFELLKCFFENQNILLTRQYLSENVWKNDLTSDKTINIALTRLRNKIPQLKEHIVNIRGMGYKIC